MKHSITFKSIICFSMLALFISVQANAQTITHETSDKGDFEDINPDKSLGNPLHLPIFAPDPSAHVWEDGRLYVYPTRDTPGQKNYYTGMDRWYVFSTDDMVNWTNHGLIFHVDDIPWADYKAWAPDCASKDGKYYFYFPVRDHDGENWMGVATSDSPTGPFSNPTRVTRGVDPHVFVDYEGNYYLAANNWIQKLSDDMHSLVGKRYSYNDYAVGFPDYDGFAHEGTWIFKRNGLYYLTTAASAPEPRDDGNKQKHVMLYGIGESPTGPFTYKGILMNTIGNPHPTGGLGNIHGSVVEYKGRWILFYHKLWKAPDGNVERAMCADYITFNEDGTIQEVIPTDEGVDFR